MSKLRNKVLVTGVLLHTLRSFSCKSCEIGCLNITDVRFVPVVHDWCESPPQP